MNRNEWILTLDNNPVSFSDKPFRIKMSIFEKIKQKLEFIKRRRAMRGTLIFKFKDVESK